MNNKEKYNIDDYQIGEYLQSDRDKECETFSQITNKTSNTIEIFEEKKTNKGISCKQWYSLANVNKYFKKIEN